MAKYIKTEDGYKTLRDLGMFQLKIATISPDNSSPLTFIDTKNSENRVYVVVDNEFYEAVFSHECKVLSCSVYEDYTDTLIVPTAIYTDNYYSYVCLYGGGLVYKYIYVFESLESAQKYIVENGK